MTQANIFQTFRSARFCALLALVGLGLLLTASGAKAGGCAVPDKFGPLTPLKLVAAGHAEGQELIGPPSIVGLWHLIYTADFSTAGPLPVPVIPPGPPESFQFLESFKTWHGDGTEFENAFLAPASGNICFGVWADLGRGTVKLHHIGLMFGGPGAVPPEDVSNVFTVDETDTVAPNGRTYSGFFDFKLYLQGDCADSPAGYVCTGKPLQEIKGTTAGTRIAVD